MTRSSRTTRALVSVLALLGGCSVPVARAEDAIQYWTNYAIYPQRCITYNNIEQVRYAMYEQSSNHCGDAPLGTYVAAVSDFAAAYLEQQADNAADTGQDNYTEPTSAAYLNCTYEQINGADYYL